MEIFNNRLQSYINGLNMKKRAKYTIDNATYEKILQYFLSNDVHESSKFKFWAKKTFLCVKIGNNHLVYDKKSRLPLVTHENLYETIYQCHINVGHSGRDKTWAEIKRNYSGIPIKAVVIFLKMCDACQTRRSVPKPSATKSIVSVGFMTRLQMDLIDMRSVACRGFNFILHVKDHFTKFSWLAALPSKEAKNVANFLCQLFYTFGPPRILQSDNGKEFVAKVIHDLKTSWPDMMIINVHPRHPQSQGLIERSNAVVQKTLGKWQETNKTDDWPNCLGMVMFSINNSVSQSTKKTPYELVFSQTPRDNQVHWMEIARQVSNDRGKSIDAIDEENLCGLMTLNEKTNENAGLTDHESLNISGDNSHDIIDDYEKRDTSTNHTTLRREAEICYLKAAERQNRNYEKTIGKQKHYDIGDIVGIKIAEVDRSNTAPCIMPVKIIDKFPSDTSSNICYTVASTLGIISGSYYLPDLVDLTETVSYDLRHIDESKLSTVSIIQASHHFTKFRSSTACNCNGTCQTNRCVCVKKSIPCGSKCHHGKASSCVNV